jgi:nitrogen fixation NifU-like protein
MYSDQVLDHFQNPRNVGDLKDATVSVELQNPACGDVLRLALRVEKGCVIDASFRAKGCVPAIACGSKLVELVRSRTVAEASSLTQEGIIQELGGLPQASGHAAALAIDALRLALKKAASTCVDHSASISPSEGLDVRR